MLVDLSSTHRLDLNKSAFEGPSVVYFGGAYSPEAAGDTAMTVHRSTRPVKGLPQQLNQTTAIVRIICIASTSQALNCPTHRPYKVPPCAGAGTASMIPWMFGA